MAEETSAPEQPEQVSPSEFTRQLFEQSMAHMRELNERSMDEIADLNSRVLNQLNFATTNAINRSQYPQSGYIIHAIQLDPEWGQRIHEESLVILREHGVLPPEATDGEEEETTDTAS